MNDSRDRALTALLSSVCQQLDIVVTSAQQIRLLAYVGLLQRWNATYNLTAVEDPEEMISAHLADCLAVVGPLRRQLGERPSARLLDVGSGAGLPGCVIAMTEARVDVVCVDSVGKKAAFVQHVAGELRLPNLTARHARVEQLDAAPFDVVASRAFASLSKFVALTRHAIAADGAWMAMKGKRPDLEIEQLSNQFEVFHVEQLDVPLLLADRCLVWIRQTTGKRPPIDS